MPMKPTDFMKMESLAESPSPIRGTGGGLGDMVPAHVMNKGENMPSGQAMVSEGEFVWPADVVAFVGNGSSEAGARILNKMAQEIRKQMKKGGKKQSPSLSKLLKNTKKK